ncbi:hypothetical protein ASPZODRAFT_135140 [Penicilliopsis zonata CBS 506.65]|uniref:Uncharacterized protein n=1 Tax=Penicilliopsis zonata CBS 506.65 TaxID=1073090 RepID=A0A1L9SAV8_9EURO|nr:hypothetical protein ASPZODRAFT_135140 [Penicilliopsis zonata CBS 506.65]OJJ44320.1 hypothetical protein ASPZODRAFT_135140 [Penicilliopsis zonata CBS 506.65]
MTSKTTYSTSSPYEEKFGYYRAVRTGSYIFVAGTTAVDPNSPASAPQVLFPGDARRQTVTALRECIAAIEAVAPEGGPGAASVVRVKMYVGRHEDCEAVGAGFREVLGKDQNGEDTRGTGTGTGLGAVATMIVVHGGFVHPDMLVEVEVDAVLRTP